MYTKEGIRTLHRETHGCLDTLIRHIATLPAELFTREVPGFGRSSLRHQLVHIVSVESAWVCGLRGVPVVRVSPEDHPTLDSLVEAQRSVADATLSYLDALTEAELNTELNPLPPEWVGPPRSPAFILLHVITHAFHHKGQAAILLRLLGHPPPDTDLQR